MHVEEISIQGCFLIDPQVFKDERGHFYEAFNQREFEKKTGLQINFVQDNHSVSYKGVLRGLHYQASPHGQSKLIRVAQGSVLDVLVDIRPDSSTYGKHYKKKLSGNTGEMIFIPKGIAHGFLALEENTHFLYKCDSYYNPGAERGIRFDDPYLDIDWEFDHDQLILSGKDKLLPLFKDLHL